MFKKIQCTCSTDQEFVSNLTLCLNTLYKYMDISVSSNLYMSKTEGRNIQLNMKKKIVVMIFILNACWLISDGGTSCELNINNCNYTLSLSPSNSCHGNSHSKRPKRSASGKVEISSELIPVVTILSKRMKRIQNKLSREMEALSTRVLRGVRKIETLMSEDNEKQATKRGVSFSQRSCPPGFVTLDRWQHCYMFSKFNTTWYEARDFCAAFNSDMVAMGSLKEHYIVTFLIKNNIGELISFLLFSFLHFFYYLLCFFQSIFFFFFSFFYIFICLVTLKVLCKILADSILIFFLYYFSQKIRLNISCELTAITPTSQINFILAKCACCREVESYYLIVCC